MLDKRKVEVLHKRHKFKQSSSLETCIEEDSRKVEELADEDKISWQVQKDSTGSPHLTPQILVADDQAINLRVMEKSLSDLNLLQQTIMCTDGQETVDKVKWLLLESKIPQPIAVMILDFQMPKMNGLKVAQEVKQMFADYRGVFEMPRIVFLSAYMSPVFEKHLQEKGYSEIYEKPLLNHQLCKILQPLLEYE